MDLIQRLKTFLDSRGIGVTQFADECAIPRPTASQLLAGRNKKVSDEMIGKIHQVYPELSVMWLMFGEGNMLVSQAPVRDIEMQSSTTDASQSFFHSSPVSPYSFGTEIPGINRQTEDNSQNLGPQTPPAASPRQAPGAARTFSFDGGVTPPENASQPAGSMVGNANRQTSSPAGIASSSDRKIVGVVVFYDDNSFSSFVPDGDFSLPFIPKIQ